MLDTQPVKLPASPAEPQIGLNAGDGGPLSDGFTPEIQSLRADLNRLLDQQKELMQLLGTKRADKLVHDVRNLLQERMFLEAACKRFGA